MHSRFDTIRPIAWVDDCLRLLDQRRLPVEERYVSITTLPEAISAIRSLVVRGAPAIGITAAYAVVLSLRAHLNATPGNWRPGFDADLEALTAARPTAVNLMWAIRVMRRAIVSYRGNDLVDFALREAQRLHREDIETNQTLGSLGARLLPSVCSVLTHCNTGSLATGGYGTALGVIRAAAESGALEHVYVDETRPWLQGSRLSAWELDRDRIPFTLVADGVAATLMRERRVNAVVVGADRVAANGDVANKIGTYSLAVLAGFHGIPFIVAAPTTTIDLNVDSGAEIPIEVRDSEELTHILGKRISPEGINVWNPVFDVTPAVLVDALVTEIGVVFKPTREAIEKIWATSK